MSKYIKNLENEIKELKQKIYQRQTYNLKLRVKRFRKTAKLRAISLTPFIASTIIIATLFEALGINIPGRDKPFQIDADAKKKLIEQEASNIEKDISIKIFGEWQKKDDEHNRQVYYFNLKNIDISDLENILQKNPSSVYENLKLIKIESETKKIVNPLNRDYLEILAYNKDKDRFEVIKVSSLEDLSPFKCGMFLMMIFLLALFLTDKFHVDVDRDINEILKWYPYVNKNEAENLKIKLKIREKNLKELKGDEYE